MLQEMPVMSSGGGGGADYENYEYLYATKASGNSGLTITTTNKSKFFILMANIQGIQYTWLYKDDTTLEYWKGDNNNIPVQQTDLSVTTTISDNQISISAWNFNTNSRTFHVISFY